jgi:hypothetical protein
MQAGASIDNAIAVGSKIALRPNVSASSSVTQIIQERMILAVLDQERS